MAGANSSRLRICHPYKGILHILRSLYIWPVVSFILLGVMYVTHEDHVTHATELYLAIFSA